MYSPKSTSSDHSPSFDILPMTPQSLFLHLTDLHLSESGQTLQNVDSKRALPLAGPSLKEDSIETTLQNVNRQLSTRGDKLSGVLVSGDIIQGGKRGTLASLYDLLQRSLGEQCPNTNRIVVVPGNHDVPRNTLPDSPERYKEFVNSFRKNDFITPVLDGIDIDRKGAFLVGSPEENLLKHCLFDAQYGWAIFPVNTSNWSHVLEQLPDELSAVWKEIPKRLRGEEPGGDAREEKLREQLQKLIAHDVTLVSEGQLNALRELVRVLDEQNPRMVKLAVLHHHLLPVSERQEHKSFSDLLNLGTMRQVLAELDFQVVLHGHKHVETTYYDHVYDYQLGAGRRAKRYLVVSGATLTSGDEPVGRLIGLKGLLRAPICTVMPFGRRPPGRDVSITEPIEYPIGNLVPVNSEPIVVSAEDPAELYHLVLRAIRSPSGRDRHVICHLDAQGLAASLPIAAPDGYPAPPGIAKERLQDWFREIVAWWQISDSVLAARIPFVHGMRLNGMRGRLNQMERLVQLLSNGTTSKALLLLIDPNQDFYSDVGREPKLPSFCLAQFSIRKQGGQNYLDCTGYYRVQEFTRWWPINIAEIRHVQIELCGKATPGNDGALVPGRITTVCTVARLEGPLLPTQVAVPTIDRLLDRNQQELLRLAEALARYGDVQSEERQDAYTKVLELIRENVLDNTSVDPMQVTVALDGLKFLFESATTLLKLRTGSDSNKVIDSLRRIYEANVTFAAHQVQPGLKRWQASVQSEVQKIETLLMAK